MTKFETISETRRICGALFRAGVIGPWRRKRCHRGYTVEYLQPGQALDAGAFQPLDLNAVHA